jgi:hypothetical protein
VPVEAMRGFPRRGVRFTRLDFWPGENSMSRMSWPMMAAFVIMGVIALLLLSGPWSPRVVEKDPAGMLSAARRAP